MGERRRVLSRNVFRDVHHLDVVSPIRAVSWDYELAVSSLSRALGAARHRASSLFRWINSGRRGNGAGRAIRTRATFPTNSGFPDGDRILGSDTSTTTGDATGRHSTLALVSAVVGMDSGGADHCRVGRGCCCGRIEDRRYLQLVSQSDDDSRHPSDLSANHTSDDIAADDIAADDITLDYVRADHSTTNY